MLSTTEILTAALTGYQIKAAQIETEIQAIRERLNGGTPTDKPRRKISAAGRKRMAAAQRKRWADRRKG